MHSEAEASHPKKISSIAVTAGDRSVTLDWSRPSGTVQDYIIEYKRDGSSTWIRVNDGVNTLTQYTVTGLTNGVEYDFHVAAKKLSNPLLRFSNTISATPSASASTPPTPTPTTPATTPPTPRILEAIPQDHSVILTWSTYGANSNAITDYVIQYKGSWQSSWTTLNDGTSTTKKAEVTGLYNNLAYQFKVAAKIGSQIGSYSAVKSATPTENCSQRGADGDVDRCYATRTMDLKRSNERSVTGINGTINFDDKVIPAGFNQASYWLKFTNGKILEVGIHDMSGSGAPKFVCAIDGSIQTHSFSSRPLNNVDYEMRIEKRTGSVNTWDLIVNGEICATESLVSTAKPNYIIRGTETSKNNAPDFTQEFEELKKEKYNRWYYLASYDGSDYQSGLSYGYFIDRCGSGNEKIYHIETGKGTPGAC